MFIVIVSLFIGLVWLLFSLDKEERPLRVLSHRPCSGLHWRRCYTNSTSDDIRQYLAIVSDAFGYPKPLELKLRPSDRVMELYYIRNPPGPLQMADDMELEHLSLSIEETYGIDLDKHWHHGITLGEIYDLTHPQHGR